MRLAVCRISALLPFAAAVAFAQSRPPTNVSAAAATASGAQTAAPTFEIDEYRVLGNSTLPVRTVESAVYSHLGPGKTIQDVEAARHALEDAYHAAGYGTVFVDIPEQEVSGVVRLKVTEGTIHSVHVAGTHYFSNRRILSAIPEATVGNVPNFPSMQDELARVNAQSPDRTVTPVLKAGPVPGTMDVAFNVSDRLPLHGSLEINNQATPETSELRMIASLSYDNLFGRFDSASLQYQMSPQDPSEVGLWIANYTAHLNDAGARWSFMYVDSSSNVTTLGALAVVGKGKIIGTRLTEPLIVNQATSQSFTLGLDFKDFSQSIEVDPTSTLATPIKYLNASLAYAGAWRLGAFQSGIDASLNFGLRGPVGHDDEFANDRFDASANYSYLRTNATAGYRLPGNFTVLWRLSGQYTTSPLISNEQLTVGGAASVRGYLEAEELGDIGVVSSIQFGTPIMKFARQKFSVDSFLFYDFGRVSTLDALPGETSNHELRSVGVGINLDLFDHFSGALTWAYALADATETTAGASQVLFKVIGTW